MVNTFQAKEVFSSVQDQPIRLNLTLKMLRSIYILAKEKGSLGKSPSMYYPLKLPRFYNHDIAI